MRHPHYQVYAKLRKTYLMIGHTSMFKPLKTRRSCWTLQSVSFWPVKIQLPSFHVYRSPAPISHIVLRKRAYRQNAEDSHRQSAVGRRIEIKALFCPPVLMNHSGRWWRMCFRGHGRDPGHFSVYSIMYCAEGP